MEFLHEGHPRKIRMKSLARFLVWWPGIDYDLKERVKQCDACQRMCIFRDLHHYILRNILSIFGIDCMHIFQDHLKGMCCSF